MKHTLIVAALLAVTLAGCSYPNDVKVSSESHRVALALSLLSEDVVRDGDTYLADFETRARTQLDAARSATIQELQNRGELTPENVDTVNAEFLIKQGEVTANIAAAKAKYAARAELLTNAAQQINSIDGYYQERNVKPWYAFGKGFVEGIMGQGSVLQDIVNKLAASKS